MSNHRSMVTGTRRDREELRRRDYMLREQPISQAGPGRAHMRRDRYNRSVRYVPNKLAEDEGWSNKEYTPGGFQHQINYDNQLVPEEFDVQRLSYEPFLKPPESSWGDSTSISESMSNSSFAMLSDPSQHDQSTMLSSVEPADGFRAPGQTEKDTFRYEFQTAGGLMDETSRAFSINTPPSAPASATSRAYGIGERHDALGRGEPPLSMLGDLGPDYSQVGNNTGHQMNQYPNPGVGVNDEREMSSTSHTEYPPPPPPTALVARLDCDQEHTQEYADSCDEDSDVSMMEHMQSSLATVGSSSLTERCVNPSQMFQERDLDLDPLPGSALPRKSPMKTLHQGRLRRMARRKKPLVTHAEPDVRSITRHTSSTKASSEFFEAGDLKILEGWLEKKQGHVHGQITVTEGNITRLADLTEVQPWAIHAWFQGRGVPVAITAVNTPQWLSISNTPAADDSSKRDKDMADVKDFIERSESKECSLKNDTVGKYRCRRPGCSSRFPNFDKYYRHQLDKFHPRVYRCLICGRINGRRSRDHIIGEKAKEMKKDPAAYPLKWKQYQEEIAYDPGRCTYTCGLDGCVITFAGERRQAWDDLQRHQWDSHIVPAGDADAMSLSNALSSRPGPSHDNHNPSASRYDRFAYDFPSPQFFAQDTQLGHQTLGRGNCADLAPNPIFETQPRTADINNKDMAGQMSSHSLLDEDHSTDIKLGWMGMSTRGVDGLGGIKKSCPSAQQAPPTIPEAPSPPLSMKGTSFDDVSGRRTQSSDSEPCEPSKVSYLWQSEDFEPLPLRPVDGTARGDLLGRRGTKFSKSGRARLRSFESDEAHMQALLDRLHPDLEACLRLSEDYHSRSAPRRYFSPASLHRRTLLPLDGERAQQLGELTSATPTRLNSLDSGIEEIDKSLDGLWIFE